jgi:hypothetical protein
MARIRTVKPDFFTSEDIVALSPLARLLYIATWLEADREGRMVWRPGTLKLRYLPGDECSVDDLAGELIDRGLVVLYEADGQQLAYIPTFTRHQIINNRETPSILPAPPDANSTRVAHVDDASGTRQRASGTRLVGKEGKGKEGMEDASSTRASSPKARRSPKAAKTSLPTDFVVSERVRLWAESKGFRDLDQHLEAFKSKAVAKGYAYVDWDEAFMGAVRDDWAKLRPTNGARHSVLDSDDVFTGAR